MRKLEQIVFGLLIAAAFAFCLLLALGFPPRARLFPLTVSVAALLLLAVDLVRTGLRPGDGFPQSGGLVAQGRAVAPYLLWIVGFYLAIAGLGFVIATGAFVFGFLLTQAKMRWWMALVSAAAVIAGLFVLGALLGIEWPAGLLGERTGFEL